MWCSRFTYSLDLADDTIRLTQSNCHLGAISVTGDELADLARKDLEPLLAVTTTVEDRAPSHRKAGGRSEPGNRAWVFVPDTNHEVRLSRSLPLNTFEAALLKPYAEALKDLSGDRIPNPVARAAADEVVLRAIAVQLGGDARGQVVEEAIRFLFRCAVSTYEGQPVHLNILLDFQRVPVIAPMLNLERLQKRDWHPLLGSGLDTGILLDQNGSVVRIENVRLNEEPDAPVSRFCPDSFRYVGNWTAADGSKVALSLSRSGELLVFQEGQLRYIYRAGQWRSLPLDVALKKGWSDGSGMDVDIKREVLASVIDASLGHHGACLAIIVKSCHDAFLASDLISQEDLWPMDPRSHLYESQLFTDLNRRQRLELLNMDGATVLDRTGLILATGAIVAVNAGSDAGGRLAATKALSGFGAAFKVSQDGPILLYGRDKDGNADREPRMVLA